MSTTTLQKAVEQAILGGCTVVQLREKNITSLNFYNLAMEIKRVTDRYNLPLIINDRIDIALSVNAAGVHLGQSDIPAAVARNMIGKNLILGVSASSVSEAIKAQKDGADYLGIGAMYVTGTKTDANIVSKEELKEIRESVKLPIVIIGGINKENAPVYRNIGIDGLAVVSAIIAQPDISRAATEIKNIFRGEEQL